MATKNPRVVGYIQPDTHAKLKEYMERNNVSESKALDLILGEYFDVDVPRVTLGSTPDIDSKINEAIAPIQNELAELRSLLSAKEQAKVGEKLSLTQAQLAARLGCDAATINRHRTKDDFAEWSCSLDPERLGWRFLEQEKLFIPNEGQLRKKQAA